MRTPFPMDKNPMGKSNMDKSPMGRKGYAQKKGTTVVMPFVWEKTHIRIIA